MDLEDSAPGFIRKFYTGTQSDLSMSLSPHMPKKAIKDLLASYRKLRSNRRRPVSIDRALISSGAGVGVPVGRYEESMMKALRRMEREKVLEAARARQRAMEGYTGKKKHYAAPVVGLKEEEEDGMIWLDCHGGVGGVDPFYIPKDAHAHVLQRGQSKTTITVPVPQQQEVLTEMMLLYRHLKGDKDLLDFPSICRWDYLLGLMIDGYLTRTTAKTIFDEAHQGRNHDKLNYADFVRFHVMLHAHLKTVYEPTVIQSQIAQVCG